MARLPVFARMHRRPSTRRRLQPQEMRRITNAPSLVNLRGWRDRAILHTLATSGCRVSELVRLRQDDIVVREAQAFLSVLGKYQQHARLTPLSGEAYHAIEAWLARRPLASPYVFTRYLGRGNRLSADPLSTTAVWQLVRDYATRVGLAHVSPHAFRRFLGTELCRTAGIYQAMKALGHSDISITVKHYVLHDLEGGLSDHLY